MQQISAQQALQRIRSGLSLPALQEGSQVDDALLVQLVRAAALTNSPCTGQVLKREVIRGLRGLADEAALSPLLDVLLAQLIEVGDLIEPGLVSQVEELPPGTLFVAPLSFSMLSAKTAFVFGLTFDDEVITTNKLLSRLRVSGPSRRLHGLEDEDIRGKLRAAGLRELSVKAWLKEPPRCTPGELVAHHAKQLKRAAPSEAAIDSLEILSSQAGSTYLSCWTSPSGQSGTFIARRPKAFGAYVWMGVQLDNGKVVQTQTFPSRGAQVRGCDEAWRLQLAIDAIAGTRQEYRLTTNSEHARFDFLFPLPLWAARRMHVLGRSVPRVRGICSFEVDRAVVAETVQFLKEEVWLKEKTIER
jgi:hypothetical protein